MNCTLCPRRCGADRAVETGFCGAGRELKIARAALHFWEEPPISGTRGSGTVFFSHCPLQCVYCQNRAISACGNGLSVSDDRLVEIFFELAAKGAHNINLVSPTQYADRIADAIRAAKARGFVLPFVWNTSGYESVETLRSLDGLVDIYLTDFKYASSALAARYSHAADYPVVAGAALVEMLRQQPKCVYNGELMTRGVIVRHLVLPSHTEDSKDVLDILSAYKPCLSLMRQYTPQSGCPYAELARPITDAEYETVVGYALLCGLNKLFLQDGESVSESFIPAFDYEGVLNHGSEQ